MEGSQGLVLAAVAAVIAFAALYFSSKARQTVHAEITKMKAETIKDFDNKISELSDTIDTLNERVEYLQTTISATRHDTKESFSDVGEKINVLRSDITQLDYKILPTCKRV